MTNTPNRPTPSARFRFVTVAGLLLALGAATALAAGERWLHIRVEDGGSRGEQVNINVPISMVSALLPMIEAEGFRGGKVRLDAHWNDDDLHGIDLREVVRALRDAPDAEFVTVRSDDEHVRVAKESGFVRIDVDESGGDKVRVVIPMTVVEALIGDDPNELDVMAAIEALADYNGGDLVTVESDDERVRIWIDDRQDQ
jgi:hypothetical protein